MRIEGHREVSIGEIEESNIIPPFRWEVREDSVDGVTVNIDVDDTFTRVNDHLRAHRSDAVDVPYPLFPLPGMGKAPVVIYRCTLLFTVRVLSLLFKFHSAQHRIHSKLHVRVGKVRSSRCGDAGRRYACYVGYGRKLYRRALL